MKTVEKRIYGTMIAMSNNHNIVKAGIRAIAHAAGYKGSGGMHTYALENLQKAGYVSKLNSCVYLVNIQ